MNRTEIINALVNAGADSKLIADTLRALGMVDDTKGKRADAPAKEMVDFVKRNGEVKRVSKAQADAWTKGREKWESNYDPEVAKKIADSKAAEPARTRALEKALKLKANSLENTACTVDQALAAGWKPKGTTRKERREELKNIKARIRQ